IQMTIQLTGQRALVTGASGGIGRGVAIALAACGAKVAVNYLSNQQGAEETVALISEAGGEAAAFQADVTDVQAVKQMVADVERTLGGEVDILVNNAGHLIRRMTVEEMSEEHYAQVMDVNLKSAVFVSQAVIPGMKARGGGRIVNVTSIAAHNGGGPGASIYAASKAAVIGFTKALAKEL